MRLDLRRTCISTFVLALLGSTAFTSCTPPPPDGNRDVGEELAEVKQETGPPTRLGLGVVWGDGEWTAGDKSNCLPAHDIKVQMDWKTNYNAGLIHETHQIQSKLKLGVGGNIELLGLIPLQELEASYESDQSQNEESLFFYVLAEIKTGERWVDLDFPGDNDPSSLCERAMSDPESMSVDAFLSQCGAQYVSREETGGVALLWVDFTSLSEVQKTKLKGAFQTNIAFGEFITGSPSIEVISDSLVEQGLGSLTFNVTTIGLPSPSPGQTPDQNGWVTTTLENWQEYLNDIHEDVVDATSGSDPNPYHGALGTVVKSHISQYSSLLVMDACDYGVDLTELGCLNEYSAQLQNYFEPLQSRESISAALDRISWRINNPDWVVWPDMDGVDVQDLYSTAIREIGDCFEEIEMSQRECYEFDPSNPPANGPESYCEACKIPTGCQIEDLREILDGLPPTDPRIPNAFVPAVNFVRAPNGNIQLAGANANICVLTGIQGKLHNHDNGVFLEKQGFGTNAMWRSNVYSDTIQISEQVAGEFVCVPRDAFSDSWSLPLGPNDSFEDDIEAFFPTVNQYTEPKEFIALGGVKGRFMGGGESVNIFFTNEPNEHWSVEADSQQTGWSVYATLWRHRFSEPAGGKAQIWRNADDVFKFSVESYGGAQTVNLAPTSEALCYLARVKGHFDGGGENVRIRIVDNRWQLHMTAGGTKHIGASAMCVRYNQSGQ